VLRFPCPWDGVAKGAGYTITILDRHWRIWYVDCDGCRTITVRHTGSLCGVTCCRMDFRGVLKIEKNVKAARTHRALGLLYGLASILFIVFMFPAPEEKMVMLFCFALFLGLAALHFWVAKGARNGQNWARVTPQIIGVLMLPAFQSVRSSEFLSSPMPGSLGSRGRPDNRARSDAGLVNIMEVL